MRVFVLNSGRCGSSSFFHACQHITNYTSAHASRQRMLGDARLDYPDNHIELGNRLVWFLGRLDERFGTEPLYLHLRRDPAAVARSWAGRMERARNSGIISAYAAQIARYRDWQTTSDLLPVCEDYVRTVTENIHLFLKDKPNQMDFWIESYATDWPRFWETIGAAGDHEAALSTFSAPINTTSEVIERDRLRRLEELPRRILRRALRFVKIAP